MGFITTVYKGLMISCLLAFVFSQQVLKRGEDRGAKLTPNASSNIEEKLAEDKKLMEEQAAANAVYKFATSLVDGIMDNLQVRTEQRNGLNLTGSYEYSDGFVHRVINYVADENGYRVTSEVIESLGEEGPRVNPDGQANVQTSIAGGNYAYNITNADIRKVSSLSPA